MNAPTSLVSCLRYLLRPVARFCVRHSLRLQDFNDQAKLVFVEVAREELERDGSTVNISRLSVVSGVHRSDVVRILKQGGNPRPSSNPISRIINNWEQLKQFQTASGKPRVLSAEGTESEFAALVRTVNKDLNPYIVLFELQRVGSVERNNRGARLLSPVLIPRADAERGFALLSLDADDLFTAVEENVLEQNSQPNLHIRTQYDNLAPSALPEIRSWLLDQGTLLHRRARKYLSRFDRDINRSLKDKGPAARVVLGSFSLCEASQTKKREGK